LVFPLFVNCGGEESSSTPKAYTKWQQIADETLANCPEIKGAAFGNGRFVIVDNSGAVFWAGDNGANWTAGGEQPINGFGNRNGLRFVNGKFYICGSVSNPAGPAEIVSSSNGESWDVNDSPKQIFPDDNQRILDIAYGNGTYVILCQDTGKIAYSTDKMATWTLAKYDDDTAIDLTVNQVVYEKGIFVVVGGDKASKGGVDGAAWSADGITWTKGTPVGTPPDADGNGGSGLADSMLWALTYGNNRFVAVKDSESAVSNDGKDWSLIGFEKFSTSSNTITFADGKFIIGGATTAIMSTDGVVWTNVKDENGVDEINAVFGSSKSSYVDASCWGNGRFLLVGTNGSGGVAVISTN